MKDKTNRWYRLDNQGKIFPEVYNEIDSHTFRVQISLNEIIDPTFLQTAVNNILDRFPMYKVRLRRGMFWTYLEENEKPFFVSKMPYKVCGFMDFKKNNDYLFRVFYNKETIAVEIFHTLTDGTGLVEFIKSLTYEYLKLKGYNVTPDNLVKTTTELSMSDESEDSSKKYYSQVNKKRVKEKQAYSITGTTIPGYDIKLISGIFSTKEIIKIAKENGVSITEYLVAVAINSIYQTKIKYRTQLKENRNPVKIGVPVNLRKRFPSTSLRNFVNIVSVGVDTSHDDLTFEDILKTVKQELASKTTIEELTRVMSEYVSYEKNIFIRLMPSIIKKYASRVGFSLLGSILFTFNISNVGKVEFPPSMEPYINDMSFMIGAGRNSRINAAVISFKDKFKVSFTGNIIETTIQKEFIRHFTSMGLEVEIESNYMEENL